MVVPFQRQEMTKRACSARRPDGFGVVCGLEVVMFWSSTVELLPAASVTVTASSWGPSGSPVVGTGTSTTSLVRHGCW